MPISNKRCLMLAGASILDTNGYSIRVWMALKAVRTVQGESEKAPVLVSFESMRSYRRKPDFSKTLFEAQRLGVQLVIRPLLPKKIPGSTHLNYLLAAGMTRRTIHKHQIGVIHAQSHFAAGVAAKAVANTPQKNFVFDVHGVDIEERLADGRLSENSQTHQLLKSMQSLATKRCNYAFPVTHALAEHLQIPEEKCRVVPCVSSLTLPQGEMEQTRKDARHRLSLENKQVLLYLGGASAWQQPRFIMECFDNLRKINPSAVLLLITGDTAYFSDLATEFEIPSEAIRILSLPHEQVSSIACAADAGLLLRQDTIVNRVASPTKFAEYLAVGVPVVLTDVLGDFSKIVKKHDVGCSLPSNTSAIGVAEEIDRLLNRNSIHPESSRQRCKAAYQHELSFESILPIYREVYI
jgi:glycosyltransferase involved in cell wall biosynthesis